MCPVLPARIRIVQSQANRWIKALRCALVHPPAAAEAAGSLLALEGVHLIAEALRTGLAPSALFFCAGEENAAWHALSQHADLVSLDSTEMLALPRALFRSLAATESPQPLAALIPLPTRDLEHLFAETSTLLLVLAAVQDPGNVGTLLRSAEAFGATGALLLTGTASPWNAKALRASAGSALRLPWHTIRSPEEAAALLRAHSIISYAAVPSGGVLPAHATLDRPAAIWIGNEGAGLSVSELAACDARLTLPMPGVVESLNAAVAGSLLLYEASRQRQTVHQSLEAAQQRAASQQP